VGVVRGRAHMVSYVDMGMLSRSGLAHGSSLDTLTLAPGRPAEQGRRSRVVVAKDRFSRPRNGPTMDISTRRAGA
jgi:hypothetical protein